jgi:tetratricopeptide (TPR) repeat protein
MAERDLRTAFRLKPAGQQLEWYWMLQADIATFKNRDLEAAADYSKAAAATPDDPGARFIAQFCRGAAERRAANFANSISDYDAALRDGKTMTRLMPRILSGLDEKSRRRAQAQFDRATKIWRASLLRARAETWRAEARYDDALRDYAQAIALMPRDPKLFAGRGQTQVWRGNWRAGLADLLAAASLSFAGRPLRSDRTVACGP